MLSTGEEQMADIMTKEELEAELTRTGALMEGHFLLASGLHSGYYLQCARLLQHPDLAERIGASIAALFPGVEIDAVAAPAVGGVIVAHEVARALGVRAIFSEREAGVMTFRRGLGISEGEGVAVVEDVITTGGSIRETIEAVARLGGRVAAAGCILDRSGGEANLGTATPLRALLTITFPTYAPEGCPLCAEGMPLEKPGSKIQAR